MLLQHFRGDLDNWGHVLIDVLAGGRRVISFDNMGVGGSSGVTPPTVEQMARDAMRPIGGLDLEKVDLLGLDRQFCPGQLRGRIGLKRPDFSSASAMPVSSRCARPHSAPQSRPVPGRARSPWPERR